MCTGRMCFCSEVVLNSGAREMERTINRGKFLLAFSWGHISEKAGLSRAKSLSLFLGFFFKECVICGLLGIALGAQSHIRQKCLDASESLQITCHPQYLLLALGQVLHLFLVHHSQLCLRSQTQHSCRPTCGEQLAPQEAHRSQGEDNISE